MSVPNVPTFFVKNSGCRPRWICCGPIPTNISTAVNDEDTYVQIIGEVTEWHTIGIGKAQRLSATFFDGTHQCELVWFQGAKYVKLAKDVKYLLFGKPSRFNHLYNFVHPDLTPWSKVTPEMTQGLEPYYNTTEAMKRHGLNSKAIRWAYRTPSVRTSCSDTD